MGTLRKHLVPILAVLYYLAMTAALTYPGYLPFNRIRPFVFGLPFSLFWQIIWICGAILTLTGVYVWETRRNRSATRHEPAQRDRAGE